GRENWQYPPVRAEPRELDRLREEHFLAEKAVEQRQACHGPGRNDAENRRVRHIFETTVDAAHVAGTTLVVDDTRRHEERCLEYGMIDDVKHARDGAHRRVETEQQGNQTKVADG